nr:hypothetical protein [Salmonella sp.]
MMRDVDIAAVSIATTAHQVSHQQVAEDPAVIVIVAPSRRGWLSDDYRCRAVTVTQAERNQGKQHVTSNQQMFLFHLPRALSRIRHNGKSIYGAHRGKKPTVESRTLQMLLSVVHSVSRNRCQSRTGRIITLVYGDG